MHIESEMKPCSKCLALRDYGGPRHSELTEYNSYLHDGMLSGSTAPARTIDALVDRYREEQFICQKCFNLIERISPVDEGEQEWRFVGN